MRKFKVVYIATSYQHQEVEVEAETAEQAQELGYDKWVDDDYEVIYDGYFDELESVEEVSDGR